MNENNDLEIGKNFLLTLSKSVVSIKLYNIVKDAIIKNNKNLITDVFQNKELDIISKEEKEVSIFSTVYYDCKVPEVKDNAFNIMHYLIFDYKINEENAIKNIDHFDNEIIKNMFKTRKIKNELNSELNNNHIVTKKPKI